MRLSFSSFFGRSNKTERLIDEINNSQDVDVELIKKLSTLQKNGLHNKALAKQADAVIQGYLIKQLEKKPEATTPEALIRSIYKVQDGQQLEYYDLQIMAEKLFHRIATNNNSDLSQTVEVKGTKKARVEPAVADASIIDISEEIRINACIWYANTLGWFKVGGTETYYDSYTSMPYEETIALLENLSDFNLIITTLAAWAKKINPEEIKKQIIYTSDRDYEKKEKTLFDLFVMAADAKKTNNEVAKVARDFICTKFPDDAKRLGIQPSTKAKLN